MRKREAGNGEVRCADAGGPFRAERDEARLEKATGRKARSLESGALTRPATGGGLGGTLITEGASVEIGETNAVVRRTKFLVVCRFGGRDQTPARRSS